MALPFLVRGSHNTVTACSLPTWLPADIVDAMNKYFGSLLRQELVKLMGSSELFRSRTQSTGSQRLSVDSSEGQVASYDVVTLNKVRETLL
jgi:hypothetical protein